MPVRATLLGGVRRRMASVSWLRRWLLRCCLAVCFYHNLRGGFGIESRPVAACLPLLRWRGRGLGREARSSGHIVAAFAPHPTLRATFSPLCGEKGHL